MSNPIHIIEAVNLTIGDIISWNGLAFMIGNYHPTPVGPDDDAGVHLTLCASSDGGRDIKIAVASSKKIRVLIPRDGSRLVIGNRNETE